MKKNYIFVIAMALSLSATAQQDPQYNLYQFNQMVINPAYAGARDVISVSASVRRQWTGFEGAPKTACMSAHMPILNKNLGVGVTVIQDEMGPRSNTAAYANAAYILKTGKKSRLSFGIAAGYSRYQFNFSKLSFKYTENSTELLSTQNKGVLDINAGLFFRTNKFFAGLSTTHLSNATVFSYQGSNGDLSYKLKTHTFLTMGHSFQLSENVIFAPTIMIKMAGAGTGDINLNFFIFKKAWIGLFVRGGYGPGFLTQYHITNKFRVGYSFDTGANDARRLGPAHEIMLGFDFAENKSKVVSPRFL